MMRKCKRIVPALLALCLSLLLILQASGTALDEAAAVAAEVRKKMIARETEIAFTVTVPTSLVMDDDAFHEYLNDYFKEVNRLVIEHDGTLKGGDFLHKHIGRYSYNVPAFSYYPGSETTDVSGWFSYYYYTSAAQEKELDDAVGKVLEELALDGSSDLDKLKAVYGYITSNVTYDYDNLYDDDYVLKYSAYAAQVNGTAVCQGYANLFYLYMQLVGIDCRIITGQSIGTNGTWEGHAWNIVKLGDLYYNCDATWDSGGVDTPQYFLRGTTDFPNHVSDAEFLTEAFTTAYPIAEKRFDLYSHTHTPETVPGYAATCTAPGLTDGVICSVCKEVLTAQTEIPALGHDYVADVTAAACTEGGYTTYTCSRCNESYIGNNTSPLGHAFGDWYVTTAPTCTVAGEETRVCGRCSFTETRAVPAGGHRLSHTPAAAPTCTENGNLEYYYCEVCGTYFADANADKVLISVIISSLGHDFIYHDGKAPTCIEDGWNAYQTCARCDYTTYEELPAPGHDFVAAVTAAACTEGGYTTYTCSRCNDSYIGNKTSPLGHAFGDWYVTTAPTCTEAGEETRVCSRCSFTETRIVAACGHILSHVAAKAPTCTENGNLEYYYCEVCGSYFADANAEQALYGVIIYALGHDYIYHDGKAPTCIAYGWNAYQTCSRCDYTTYEVLPELGHDFVDAVTAATCTEGGYTTYTCSRCSESYIGDNTSPLGHTFGDWYLTSAPTCTVAGEETRVCSRCSFTETRAVPAGGHVLSHTAAAAPTCTEDGNLEYYYCEVCGTYFADANADKVLISVIISSLGHDYVDHEGRAPTCIDDGWKAYQTCTRCNFTTYEELAALGHDLVDHPAQAPTCSEIGWNAYQTCSRCDYTTYKELPRDPDAHVFNITVIPPTCMDEGYTSYACKYCRYGYSDNVVPATGHAYSDPIYEWSEDLSEATAKVVCANDPTHVIGETVKTEVKIKQPTCTEPGEAVYTAAFKNKLFYGQQKIVVLDPLGHDYIENPAQGPTCEKIGWNAYRTCSRCDYTEYQEIPALGHDYGDPIYEWSEDLNEATAKVVCANDSTHVIGETVKTEVKIKQPTCTEPGEAVYTAAFNSKRFYSQQKIVEIPALGHDYVDREGKSPTCTEPGWNAYRTCSRCDYSSFVELPAAGHAWGKWENLNETLHKRVCANDPAHTEEAEHVWDQGGITKPATPTAEGEKTYTCTECGAVLTEPLARLPEEQPAFTPGDLDFDGKVSAADARLALRASVKLESFWNDPASPVFLAADADGDGKITAADARKILRVSVKLETFA